MASTVEQRIILKIAEEIGSRKDQVISAVALLDEGATVPFIASYRKEIGVDAKVALTSSLNLDLTVNPDFSQVEVDVQQTNLDRFELFFPERRHFFLENADIFGNFGYGTIRPFFSRRIGLEAPIKYGARLSGKPNKNWRLGAMNMQTDGFTNKDSLYTPEQNFSVLSVQRRVAARSFVSGIFVNKHTFDYDK